MLGKSKCWVRDFGKNFLEMGLKYKDVFVVRRFEIQKNKLIIDDRCNKKLDNKSDFKFYSNGYGKLTTL